MPLPKILKRKQHIPKVHGEADKAATRAFTLNRSLLANQWILIAMPVMALGIGLISYASFALPAGCGIPEHPDGMLVQQPGDASVYLMKDGMRRGITSEQALYSYGYNFGMVKTATCGDLGTAIGAPIGFRVGTLITSQTYNTSGYNFYTIQCGEYWCPSNSMSKAFIPTSNYYNLGYVPSNAMVLPDSMFNALPVSPVVVDGTYHPAGNLVTYGGVIYMPFGGNLYGVPTQQIAASWHMDLSSAKPATAYELTWAPGILGFMEGTLVAAPSTGGTIWAIDHTTGSIIKDGSYIKRGIANQTAFNDLGLSYNDVYNIPDSELPGGSGPVITEAANPPIGAVDNPSAGATISGTYVFGGWAVDAAIAPETPIRQVDVSIDGLVVGVASWGTGGARSDVCTSYPNRPGCPYVGWQFSYDTHKLSNGSHTIRVTIADWDPSTHYYQTPAKSFTVNNQTPTSTNLQPDILIDNINDPGTAVTSVNGWALDNMTKAESAITKVAISVNGTLVGNASYGLARSDVCTAYPNRPGCPYVGWSMSFNSAGLPAGTNTLQATATDATGLTRTATKTFLVNVTGGGGTATDTTSGALPRSTVDRAPGSTQRIHLVYAVAAGTTDRKIDSSGAITHSMIDLQNLLRSKTGRTLRLDTYNTRLDVTFVALPHSQSYYRPLGNGFFSALKRDVSSKLPLAPGKKYIVIADAGSTWCGEGELGGNFAYIGLKASQPIVNSSGQVISHYSCDDTTFTPAYSNTAGYDTLITMLHETFHTLGAVQGGSACVHYNNGHVSDVNDLMNPFAADYFKMQIDIGGDSYWGNNVKTGCFNIKTDSRFIN